MSFNWDWDREVASWSERRNSETCNKRSAMTDRGEIALSSKYRHNKCDENKACYDIKACDRNVRRSFEISLPITITPYALPGKPDACCGGGAKIRHGHKRCDGRRKSHEFTISQIINVEIPIEFGAEICYEDYCSEELGRCGDE
ncbi:MAG: hypothetical protein FWE20_04230 [Defluviitaleaceae bacterium]|nr:hypothetical protein [Defluviitaleaceae bacterium]